LFVLGCDAAPTILEKIPSDRSRYSSVKNSKGAFASVSSANKEADMYTPFVSRVLFSVPTMLYQYLIDNSGENVSDVSRLNHGQQCSYTAAHAESQFRVHTFTLSICERSGRFICWDRGGATVTQSFDYIKQPHILANFFWRYAHLNHRQRRYDTSVSPASPEDLQQIQHIEKHL